MRPIIPLLKYGSFFLLLIAITSKCKKEEGPSCGAPTGLTTTQNCATGNDFTITDPNPSTSNQHQWIITASKDSLAIVILRPYVTYTTVTIRTLQINDTITEKYKTIFASVLVNCSGLIDTSRTFVYRRNKSKANSCITWTLLE